jgi:hypothetical protein
MLSYIPEQTKIVSTAIVHNTFKKVQKTEEPDEESPNLQVNENDLEGVKNTKIWLAGMFKKDKNPEPLYILDLILKNGQLIPTFSTLPQNIVQSIRDIFEEGVKCL